MSIAFDIRRVTRADRDWLLALQEVSLHELARAHYDEDTIASFVASVGTMDERLIGDGTLFVAVRGATLIGCGGWSLRPVQTAARVQPGALTLRPAPRVRSLFVHPSFVRRGIGRALLAAVEHDVAAADHDCARLSATLNSAEFFRAQGYHGRKTIALRLPRGRSFAVVPMGKWLAAEQAAA
jgi:GNAT superfamily N-acetyltransferase